MNIDIKILKIQFNLAEIENMEQVYLQKYVERVQYQCSATWEKKTGISSKYTSMQSYKQKLLQNRTFIQGFPFLDFPLLNNFILFFVNHD